MLQIRSLQSVVRAAFLLGACSVSQSYPTLDPMAPLSMVFLRQEYWSWCRFLFQGIFPTQRSKPHLLWLLHWQADSLPLSHPQEKNKTLLVLPVSKVCLPLTCKPVVGIFHPSQPTTLDLLHFPYKDPWGFNRPSEIMKDNLPISISWITSTESFLPCNTI